MINLKIAEYVIKYALLITFSINEKPIIPKIYNNKPISIALFLFWFVILFPNINVTKNEPTGYIQNIYPINSSDSPLFLAKGGYNGTIREYPEFPAKLTKPNINSYRVRYFIKYN